MKKTNAVRLLELNKIPFTIVEYKYSEDQLDALSVARKIGAEPEKVFKTLVAEGSDGNNYVFVIPGNYELDVKKAARVSGVKKIELVKVKDIFNLTGYIRGGCSPIGMKKSFITFIDESASIYGEIYISAGVRGMQILLNASDLKRIVNADFSDLV